MLTPLKALLTYPLIFEINFFKQLYGSLITMEAPCRKFADRSDQGSL